MNPNPKKKTIENTPYRAAQELHQALFEQAADGIFIANQQGNCVEVNRRGCEMLGYTHEEILNLSITDLIPAEDLAHDPLQLDALQTGSPILKERRLRCKDGRFLPVEINAQIMADGRFLSIVRDISERRRAEEQLRESNERFRLLAESSVTGIYLVQDNRFRYVNPAMAHIFGYEVEEIINNLGPMDLVHPDAQLLATENMLRRIESEEEATPYDFRGLRKDGSVINVEVHGRQIKYGGKTGVIGTLVDITERKQMYEALRRSEERLLLAVEAAQMGLWESNIITGDIIWSDQCKAHYGLSPETSMSYDIFRQALHPDDRDSVEAALNRALEERTSYDETKRTIWPDGSLHWTHSRGQVYCDMSGEPDRVIGVTFDITESKRAEQERLAHLWFLESMDQVNRAIQGANDLDQMMSNVLDTVLSIFDCDRASLLFPCDPETASWHVPMERTRPEYPGVLALGIEIPTDPEIARGFRNLRAASGPVKTGPEADHPLPVEVAKRFGHKSQIAMALYPKVGKPWEFLLQQCTYPRVWTPQEDRLFQEIGQRLADGLTSLLSYRSLRESEEKYRALIQKVQTAIVLHDNHGRILASNPLAQRLLGLSENQLFSRNLIESEWHFLREDRSVMPVAEYPVSLVLSSQQPLRDYRVGIYRPDQDDVTWVLTNAEPEFNDEGEIIQVIVSFIDITELRQAEDELYASETRFRTFVDHAADAFFLHNDDKHGTILDVNHQACESLGYSRDELVGMTAHDFDAGIDLSIIDQNKARLDAGERLLFDTRHRRKDGSVFPVEIRVRPFRQGDRKLAVSLARDITERKQTEEELKKHREHLEKLVRDRTTKLSIAREKAESANQAKSNFLSNMSHELRTPLNSILGFTQILQQQAADQETSKRLGMVRQSGEHLLTLINDILDLSKIEARKLDLYPEPFHLPTFLETIVRIIEERAQRKDLLLVYEVDEALPAGVQADETRLRQVLLNLLGNAVKYTDAGQVKLLVKRLDTPADADLPTQRALLRFEVTDTGVGMTPEQAKKVFRPFEQVGDVSRRSKGTGLGLAISRQLVRMMGDDIHVESEPEIGSRFWFEVALPLTETAWPASTASEQTIIGYKGPQLTVLVVDDIDSNRTMMVDMLVSLGFDTIEAANGRQALKVAQSHQPDLILMDQRMPVMDGLTATRQLRKLPGFQTTPVISVSAGVSNEDQAEIMAAGCNASLLKPINWPDLADLLEIHLQLEWEVEEQDEDQKLILSKAEGIKNEKIVLPPRENLEELYKLAQIGSLTRIMTWAEQLATQDARYQPVANQFYQLAEEFEIDRIIQRTRQYLAQTE